MNSDRRSGRDAFHLDAVATTKTGDDTRDDLSAGKPDAAPHNRAQLPPLATGSGSAPPP
jgi:hypothetical protein